ILSGVRASVRRMPTPRLRRRSGDTGRRDLRRGGPRRRLGAVLAGVVLLAACGGSPTAPGPGATGSSDTAAGPSDAVAGPSDAVAALVTPAAAGPAGPLPAASPPAAAAPASTARGRLVIHGTGD